LTHGGSSPQLQNDIQKQPEWNSVIHKQNQIQSTFLETLFSEMFVSDITNIFKTQYKFSSSQERWIEFDFVCG
jgi:hypothetical protein